MSCAARPPPISLAMQPVRTTADRLYECGEEAEARERCAEKQESDAAEEWRHRRVGDVAPGEVAGVFEDGEFVAVEAVAVADEQMNDESRGADAAKQNEGSAVAFSRLRQAGHPQKR